MATDHTDLIARLLNMSNKRNSYDVGYFWNICDETADALAAQQAEIERLTAERDALRQDALRYRWFRISATQSFDGSPEKLDGAIDAAMAKEQK